MRYAITPLAFVVGSSALAIRQSQQCVQLLASGDASGVLGQLSDGQNRIGGGHGAACYCLDSNGGFTDTNGRGCILTPPTTQFQCDVGASPTNGFSINGGGSVVYNGNSKFYACPVNDNGEYNVYTQPAPGQTKCIEIQLGAGQSCGAGNGGAGNGGGASQPASQPGYSVPAKPSQPPMNTMPPAPQPPKETAPPASQPPMSTMPPAPQPPKETMPMPPAPQPPKETMPPAPQPPKETAPPAPAPAAPQPPKGSGYPAMGTQPAAAPPAASQPAPPQAAPPQAAPPQAAPPQAAPPQAAPPQAAPPQAAPPSNGNGNGCPADLNGEYQYPHLIIPVSSSKPSSAPGTSYNGTANGDTCSLFNFDVPQSYSGSSCSLVFLLPQQKDLQTSAYTVSGSGGLAFSKCATPASKSTSWDNKGTCTPVMTVPNAAPGNSYTILSESCPAGQTVTIEMCATGGLSLNYFQDYNPSPIGAYIRAC